MTSRYVYHTSHIILILFFLTWLAPLSFIICCSVESYANQLPFHGFRNTPPPSFNGRSGLTPPVSTANTSGTITNESAENDKYNEALNAKAAAAAASSQYSVYSFKSLFESCRRHSKKGDNGDNNPAGNYVYNSNDAHHTSESYSQFAELSDTEDDDEQFFHRNNHHQSMQQQQQQHHHHPFSHTHPHPPHHHQQQQQQQQRSYQLRSGHSPKVGPMNNSMPYNSVQSLPPLSPAKTTPPGSLQGHGFMQNNQNRVSPPTSSVMGIQNITKNRRSINSNQPQMQQSQHQTMSYDAMQASNRISPPTSYTSRYMNQQPGIHASLSNFNNNSQFASGSQVILTQTSGSRKSD
jgi:hypothetical protein